MVRPNVVLTVALLGAATAWPCGSFHFVDPDTKQRFTVLAASIHADRPDGRDDEVLRFDWSSADEASLRVGQRVVGSLKAGSVTLGGVTAQRSADGASVVLRKARWAVDVEPGPFEVHRQRRLRITKDGAPWLDTKISELCVSDFWRAEDDGGLTQALADGGSAPVDLTVEAPRHLVTFFIAYLAWRELVRPAR